MAAFLEPQAEVRILIVDDQEPIRQALRKLLLTQPSFHLCGEARDGRQAVEMAKKLDPQVILMDISMPGMDGLEATREIRKLVPNAEVLIFTQHESPQAASAARSAGARGCLTKSDAARELLVALQTVCHHRPYFPAKPGTRGESAN